MRRVVITGFGIVSCLGNDADRVTRNLKEGLSGIRFRDGYKEIGMRSQVAGLPTIDLDERIDRKAQRVMCDCAAYAYVAMDDATRSAGLSPEQVSNER